MSAFRRLPSMAEILGVDLTDLATYAAGFPHHVLAAHRERAPVIWHEATKHSPGEEGFWSVASYGQTLTVLRDPIIFSSVSGGARKCGGSAIEDTAGAGTMINMSDEASHARLRDLVSHRFSRRRITALGPLLFEQASAVLDSMPDDGEECEAVSSLAAKLPRDAIALALGGQPAWSTRNKLTALRRLPVHATRR